MRRLLALFLVSVSLSFGIPIGLAAQVAKAGSISGEAVDAGGRGVVGQRVELVQDGIVVQATTTGARGAFSFSNLAVGDYIVRVMINGTPAGVRVSLTGRNAVTNATIVTPAVAAPLGPSVPAILIPLIAGAVTATIATVTVVTAS